METVHQRLLEGSPAAPSDLAPDTSTPLLDTTVGGRLRAQAERVPDAVALMWDAGHEDQSLTTLTYAQLLAVAEACAADIVAQAGPGERVAVWATNLPEWVILECASALAGTVLTPFNTAWTDEEVRHALRLTAPRLLYVGPDNRGVDLRNRAAALAGEVPGCLPLDLSRIATDPRTIAAASAAPLPQVSAEDPFLIQFTSGTTGRAKGATLSHRAALNAGWIRALTFSADESDIWLNPVPLHHIGGSCIILLAALSSGGCYIVQPRFDPPTMVALLGTSKATRIGGVPTMLYALLDVPGADEALATVRTVGLGGTSVPPSLVERVQHQYGATASVAYAQSECPMITSTLPDSDAATVATTVGVPVPHTGLRIVTEDGQLAGRGEIGEVCVRSPITMTGYWDMPEATAEVFDADGFLHTGDLGSIDDAGVVRIHGRAREVIIRGGENIYPIEVEDVLLRHPAVASVAVLATPSVRWGEEVGAVVKLVSPAAASAADLEEHTARSLAHFKVPRHWRFVSEFPLTASGKIRKVELGALFTEGVGS